MPKVHHVKKARKDNPRAGVKKGESYYWWANRAPGMKSGVKRYSKTPPRPSQTTGNPFYQQLYAIQEDIADAKPDNFETLADLVCAKEAWMEQIEELKNETEDKFNNMPDSLQQSETGQLLEERANALDEWYSEIESVDVDEDGPSDPEELALAISDALEQIQNTNCEV